MLGLYAETAMAESRQHTIDRIRRPRVHITYDVEIGNAIEKRELPFVVGVLADLSGMPASDLPELKYRKFVEIDRDNFSEIMKVISPRLVIRVHNCLSEEIPETSIELNFSKIEDFEPQNLALQVPALATLYKKRTNLKNLITKMDGNDALEALLTQIMKNKDNLEKLRKELEERAIRKADEKAEKKEEFKKALSSNALELLTEGTQQS